jgi:hypothetical protein
MQSIVLYHLLRCLIQLPDHRPFLKGEKTNFNKLNTSSKLLLWIETLFSFYVAIASGEFIL